MSIEDKLFANFISTDNLKLAFDYIKSEIRKSSLPLDPFWTPGIAAIEVLGDSFFESLSKLLQLGEYEPGDAYFFIQHKENFGIRKIAMLNVVDRIVYQAILNKAILGKKLSRTFCPSNYYPKLSNSKTQYLQNYKPFYKHFMFRQKKSTTVNGCEWRGEFDVSAFYDNINHRILFDLLAKDLKDLKKIIELLKKMLAKWHVDNKGIPQGPEASSLLANYYLTAIDKDFQVNVPGSVEYLRYMDDVVILSSTEKDLYFGVEKLTENLSKLDLNLNAKSEIERVSTTWYEQIVFMDPYHDSESDDIYNVFNEIKQDIPELIRKLNNETERKLVGRRDLSKLKYYLKSDTTYEFAEEIIQLYPHLPSFADVICRYILPISSKEKVRFLLFKILSEHYLFRWQRFWLAKVLLLEDLKHQHPIELQFLKDDALETRAISQFVNWSREPDKLDLEVLREACCKSDNEFERNLYVSFLSKLKNGESLTSFSDWLLLTSSLEGKIVVISQFLSKTDIEKATINGSLFFSKSSQSGAREYKCELEFTREERLSRTLGFYPEISPGKEMTLELMAANNKLVLTGKMLSGKYISASNTNKPRLVKLLIALCNDHSRAGKERSCFEGYFFDKLKEQYPELKQVRVEDINLAREKTDRLTPLLGEFIEYFLEINYLGKDHCKFRRGIDSTSFDKIPEKEQTRMAELANQQLQNFVKV